MTESVVVAPLEIGDYVYRATRLTGADHGVAREIARAAVFAHLQMDSHLANVLAALKRGRAPVLGLSYVATVESGFSWVDGLPEEVVVADLALFAWEACCRGREIHMAGADGAMHPPQSWLRSGRANMGVSTLHAVDAAASSDDGEVGERSSAAARAGSPIDSNAWQQLTTAAGRYLVSESWIDDRCTE